MGLGLAHSAFAGAARCGDTRTIGRDAYRSEAPATCYDAAYNNSIKRDAEQDALNAALQRLEKFDGECRNLPGGRVEEMNVNVASNSLMQQNYEDRRFCHPAGHHEVCEIVRIPTTQTCEFHASAQVKHSCLCN